MKIRAGFVSNSSSSSFIATVAVVTDVEKFNKFKERTGFHYPIIDAEHYNKDYQWSGDFFDHLKPLSDEYNKDMIVFDQGVGPDDDMSFLDGYGDMDYSVDLSDFDAKNAAIYLAGPDDGIQIVQQTYYAGRDG